MTRFVLFLLALLLLTACSSTPPPPTATPSPVDEAVGDLSPPPTATPGGAALDIQGHRGARGLAPENTLPAFERALDLMVDTLEFDLHLSADGVPVVWHDPTLTSDKCRLNPDAGLSVPDPDDPATPTESLQIRRLTTTQLQQYLCDRNPDPSRYPDQSNQPTALAGTAFGIVTLPALLDFVTTYSRSEQKSEAQRAAAAAVMLNMETKRRPDAPWTIDDGFDGSQAGPFELAILATLMGTDGNGDRWSERAILQSFDHRSLRSIHAEAPNLRLAALTLRDAPDLAAYAAFGASIWSPDRRAVTPPRIEVAHALGLLVIPWTINDPDEMAALIEMGVDGLITDRPDLVPTR